MHAQRKTGKRKVVGEVASIVAAVTLVKVFTMDWLVAAWVVALLSAAPSSLVSAKRNCSLPVRKMLDPRTPPKRQTMRNLILLMLKSFLLNVCVRLESKVEDGVRKDGNQREKISLLGGRHNRERKCKGLALLAIPVT